MPTAPGRPRFGGLLIPNASWDDLRRHAARLEELGFDLVAVDDHVSNPVRPTQRWSEVWTLLGAIAATTSTIRLGPLVANTILRHPALLARQAMTVDAISGGRLELGLGSGYSPTDFDAVGMPALAPGDRSRRFAEAVGTVHALLRGAAPAPGTWFDASGVALRDPVRDAPTPPLTIAADGPTSLDTAARWGDRWVSFGGWGLATERAVAITRERSELLDERCAVHGRDPATVGRTLLAGSAAVNADPIWSSAGAFEDFVGRFREIGIDSFVLYWPPATVNRSVDDAVVEAIVTDVIPRLRGS